MRVLLPLLACLLSLFAVASAANAAFTPSPRILLVVSSHGPAALARLNDAEGRPLITGRRLTGFTDEEEALFGKAWVSQFPFLLESEFRNRGAAFSEAPMMLPHVVTDGRFITGQNPISVALAADALIRALGHTPAPRTPWADEHSMTLVATAIAGDPKPLDRELAGDKKAIDVPLIAIWGYYRSLQAQAGSDRAMTLQALQTMTAAAPHFPQPELAAAIEAARERLARVDPSAS